ncbi:MAG: AAA family ATPase, partial [Calditrichae bacterium]|nr:AAA family ATPase [Calditrichia bacterium]NIW80121.1 AAA family ATPase [Calditrichia bacterium]
NMSRPTHPQSPQFIKDWVNWGAGPRASQYLILGAKTRAALQGRFTPGEEDVRACAIPVMRHRIVTNFNAEAEGINTMDIINKLFEELG